MVRIGDPIALKNLIIKNRLMRSATMENMADSDGVVTSDLLRVYYDLALGGSGLIATGACAVLEQGRVWPHQMGIWSDAHVDGLIQLTKIVHRYGDGTKCTVQLHHGGMGGLGYSYGGNSTDFSFETVTDEALFEIINAFGTAALRAKRAGFDAVSVHGAHGYLISQFLSPAINPMTEKWGGSLENRLRFAVEICRAIRERVGDDMPLLWKINCHDFHENGQGMEAYLDVAEQLETAGADMIELSGGLKDQMKLRARLRKEAGEEEAYFKSALKPFRQRLKRSALALTGGIRSLSAMEKLLDDGLDLVGLCRPLICEPDLPNRLLYTPDKRTAKCSSCNKCLLRIAKQSLKCVEYDPTELILKEL